MLQAVHEGLWVKRIPYGISGITIGRQLVVVLLPSGGLWILSPIPVTPDLRTELEKLGPIEHVIGSNIVHDECLESFQRAYPTALFHAAPGLAAAKKGVKFQRELGEVPDPAWREVLAQQGVLGMPKVNEFVFLHRASRTLIITDLAFNLGFDEPWLSRLIFSLVGISLRRFAPSRLCKRFMRDRAAVRASLDRILEWDFDRILVGHGRNIETGGKEVFRAAFAFLV